MVNDSPSPSWYEPADTDDHECIGIWCNDESHQEPEWGPDSAQEMLERGPR
jgi:hypothetical protein